ncbi:unnamed protein product [Gadus morhua 'NCC']
MLFTGVKKSAKDGFEQFIKDKGLGGKISTQQVKRMGKPHRKIQSAVTGLRELMELMERRERQDLEREREAREQERRWRQLEEMEERRDRET